MEKRREWRLVLLMVQLHAPLAADLAFFATNGTAYSTIGGTAKLASGGRMRGITSINCIFGPV